MITKHLMRLALAVLLLATPLAVFAQDDGGPELKEYVSEDELFRVMLPAGWFQVEGEQGPPFPSVLFVNNEELASRAAEEPEIIPDPGDRGLMVYVLPLDLLRQFGLEIPEDVTLIELAQLVVEGFTTPEEGTPQEEVDALEIGEAKEVELDGDVTAAQVEVSELHEDGVYFVRQLNDDLIALIYTVAAKGEFDDEQLELGRQAAASVSYEGTADDILAAMTALPEVEQSDVDPSTLDGNALVDERCTVCHTRERIDTQDKDEAGWTATVDRMIGYGADLDSAERQAVISYLVATH